DAGRRGMTQSGFPWIGWNSSSPVKPPSSITWTRPAAPGSSWRSDPPPLSPAMAAASTWRGVGTGESQWRRAAQLQGGEYDDPRNPRENPDSSRGGAFLY